MCSVRLTRIGRSLQPRSWPRHCRPLAKLNGSDGDVQRYERKARPIRAVTLSPLGILTRIACTKHKVHHSTHDPSARDSVLKFIVLGCGQPTSSPCLSASLCRITAAKLGASVGTDPGGSRPHRFYVRVPPTLSLSTDRLSRCSIIR